MMEQQQQERMEEDVIELDPEHPMEENNPLALDDLPVELRACFNCRIIRTFGEYYSEGCPNCERFMKFKNSIERVVHCTTLDFGGPFFMYTSFRWQSRFKPVGIFTRGRYAVRVYGIMPSRFMFQLVSEDDNEANESRAM